MSKARDAARSSSPALPLDELIADPPLVNQRAQELSWDDLLYQYELAIDDIQALLRGLSERQVHFKPSEKAFSIAETVTHNIFSDEMFWSWLKLLATRRGREIDPGTLISGDGARDDLALPALEALNESGRALARATIETLPEEPDLDATAPHPRFGALNAKGWIYFMCLHHGVHLRQCEQTIDTPGFPRSENLQSLSREEYLRPSDRKTWLEEKQTAGRQRHPKKSEAKGKKTSTRRKTESKRVVKMRAAVTTTRSKAQTRRGRKQ